MAIAPIPVMYRPAPAGAGRKLSIFPLFRRVPEPQLRRGRDPADHAGNAEFDLSGDRQHDAADGERPLPDLTPDREVALRARPLALELLDRGERLVPQLAALVGLGGLDDLLEHGLDRLGLR